MKWLVTGASGQLGTALTNQLTYAHLDVCALDSTQLDIADFHAVDQIISRVKPDIIVNTAAWTDVDAAENDAAGAFEVNEKGVENLALVAKKNGSILIHLSSDYVFSGKTAEILHERSKLDPQSVYGYSKAAGENCIRKIYSEGSYIVRTAWLYSEYGKNFAKTMARLALFSNEEVKVVDNQVGQPTSASELARQIITLGYSSAEFGTYHGTNSGETTWYEFAQEIFRLSGADVSRVVPIPYWEISRLAKRPMRTVLGHDGWETAKISPMENWKVALEKSMPAIIDSVKLPG